MSHQRKRRTTLFSRILVRLSLPLLVLTAIFTAIQLANKVSFLNDLTQIQSRLAFNATQKALLSEIRSGGRIQDTPILRQKIEEIARFNHVKQIDLYNLLRRTPMIQTPNSRWDAKDFESIEKCLIQGKQGKSYYVRVDKDEKLLVAYMPMTNADGSELYIARITFLLTDIGDALLSSRKALGLMFTFILLTGAAIALGLAKSIIQPIQNLNKATEEIMKGNLGNQVEIKTGDEIEELADRFNHMSLALKDMKQQAEDANPLTQLPGNHQIYREVSKRILERQKFVFFHIDLDRFKLFNDHYGLALGDKAIIKTSEILRNVTKEMGTPTDFLGHQGGDDFVYITQPGRAREIAEYICEHFKNEAVKMLYSQEDFERGYTFQLDRRRQAQTGEKIMAKFPLMAISVAGVSNVKKDFADYQACMAAAIAAKSEAKKIVECSYVIHE